MASLDELKKKYLPQQSTQKTPVRNEAEPQSAAPAGNASESYLDRLKKKYIPTVDRNYINSFVTDANSFLGSAHTDYGSISPDTFTSVYGERRQKASDLNKRSFAIRQYLDDNKGSFAADEYDELLAYLDRYDEESSKSMMDFAKAMKNYEATGKSGLDVFTAEKQAKIQKEEDKTWWEKALASFAHTSDSTLPAAGVTEAYHGYREDTTYREPDERWNDDQRNTFGYLYAIDPERAYEYALEVNNSLNAGEKQEKLDKISDSAKENKVGHTLGALPASMLGLADYLSDLTESAARGTITQKEFVTPLEYSQAATGAIAEDMNEKGGTIDEDVFILGGKGWGDVYSLGFSAAQSLISAYTLGGTGTLITFIGIGGAAGVDDALARGATPDQALLYGSIVGAAEGAAEMINADNLIKITSSKTLAKYLLAMLNQGLGESVEEGATAIIENVADNIIMADKSNYHAAVEAYVKAGMTEEEAKRKAWMDLVGEVIYSAIGGFATGAGNAAVVGGVKNTIENAEAKKLYGESQQELVAEGRESAEGSESRKLADKYQQKLDRGKNLSGAQLSRLVDANERQFVAEDMANIKQAAEARLTELGEVDGVSELAGILAKQAAGQNLSKAEQSRLESSRYGKRVSNELNPENVRSGEYTSGWAQGIETNRINVDEYNRIVEAAQTAQEAETPMEAQEAAKEENTVQAQELPATEAAVEAPVEAAEDVAAVEDDAEEADESTVTLEDVSTKYGAQAGAMVHTYTKGQDVAKYDRAYGHAYDMGKSGVALSYVMNSEATAYLTEQQRELAYAAGKAASDTSAREQAEKNAKAANGKTGRKRGVVRGEGVNIADLRKSFNDTQGTAYKVLSTYAEATGIDIVLYKSEANADGDFEGAQGKFKWSEDTIYIDVNAGLANVKSVNDLAKYAMLRTFSHEFTHFLEKWNPVRYNEFRRVVFDALTERGENVHDLIEEKMAQNTGMEYDAASREVVAEAMTDILPDATFVHTLAEKHKSIFDKLLERLKEFAADLKKYFSTIGHNRDRGANALKEQVGEAVKYVDSIVKLFDEVAVEAVENYQRTVAVEEVAEAETEQVEEVDPNGLTDGERTALMVYKSGGSYTLNAKLREGVILDEHEQYIVDNLVSGLEKLPVYKGKVYRNIIFDGFGDKAARDVFVRSHVIGDLITYEGFTSTSTAVDAYPLDGDFVVHMEIESVNGRDLSGYGNNFESEVLLTRQSQFIPSKIEYAADGTPTIYLTEVVYGQEETKPQTAHGGGAQGDVSRDHSGKSGSPDIEPDQSEVQRLHTSHSGDGEVQPAISEGDTFGDSEKQGDLQGVQAEVSTTDADGDKTPSEKLADSLLAGYINEENINRAGKALTSKELYALADAAFGGTQAEGAYNRKDAYDAMELAVNQFLLGYAKKAHKSFNGTASGAVSTVEFMQDMLELLPTQNVRTQEMEDFQQFSTPPNIAYLAAWAANINASDFVLEPSAGIGGLAVFAKAWGAEVAVNELSKRRLEVLRAMGFDHLFNENAEQIDNILPDSISPSVVIMNPPFSSTAGRTANNKTSNAEKHIDQALARLRDGGRLVAVLGKSMNDTDYYRYWDKLRKSVSIRANLSIDGNNYKKYGTTWGVQIVVIDKTGPQVGETVTGRFTDLTEVPSVLEGIRNDRRNVEENRPASGGDRKRESVSDGGDRQSDTGHEGIGERPAGSVTDTKPKKNRKGADGDQRAGDRADRKGLAEESSQEAGSKDGEGNRAVGRTDIGDGDGAAEPSVSDRHQPELPLSRLSETEEVSDDGVYATFIAPEIPIKGGKKHPAVLVESAAMAAVSMPKATYRVKLPADVIKNNLSDAQLVTVTYAGQAHEQKLPDGRRKGFFIGDGTGVGKGRQIAGIILDNFMQGRTKAVWISKNDDLFGDAVRDWTATTGRSKDEVISQGKFKPKDNISMKSGILFTSYGKLKMEKGGSRLDQIVKWLGEDFDGVIAFDEAHFMGNLFGKKGKFGKSKGSLTAQAGVELQRRLPNARIVYVSATAATEVDNLAYAERIGLWGQGTAFTNAQDFISKIGASGLAAMELVIRDMKAMGTYVARSISYNGVNYDTVEHALNPMQVEIYNTMSRAWQKTMSNVQTALETTGGKYNSTERQRAMGNFYSGMQRFYNQVLTSMSMPSVIADMRRELDAGHSCVLQIVNTNEAQQNKQLAEAKANGESLDNLDLTPREALIGYLMNSFPTQMFEEYTDDDGNLRSRPVMDSAGNPVQNKEAIRQRDALVAEVNQMSIPDGPLEMLFDAFGPEAVAENTGRSRRVVPKKMSDGSITRVEESRTLNHRTADVQAFQDGKKRILVFSDAGGTGKSYHADRTEKNQQLRIHYVLQPGWVASNAVQGFGRTHRSNEASAPVYKLVTTNIKGQKRFTSTIARRLDQLGALTKGQRDTGSGMFGAKDNLETDLAKDSLREFYRRLGKGLIEDVDGMKTLARLGLKEKFTDEFGAFKINDNLARDIGTFLNRILALEVDEQNVVFDAFISIYEMELEAAIQSGTLDTGMENVKADKIEVLDDKVIRQDKNTGSETHYIQAKTYKKPKVVTTVDEMSKRRDGFVGLYKTENGAVRAVFRIADKTTEWGAIQKQFRLVGPNIGAKTSVWDERTMEAKAEAIDKAQWQKEWDAEVVRVPEYNEDTLHMLTGALLPIWNSLPQEGSTKVKRLIAHDGSTYLGRVIDKDLIDNVLDHFSVDRTREVFTAEQVMDKAIGSGVRFYLTNNRMEIFRSRVSGEWRLEIMQPYNAWFLKKTYPDLIQERIQYRDRYFIPTGEKGIAILEKMLQDNPVRSTADDKEQYQSRAYLGEDQEQQRTDTLTDRDVLALAAREIRVDNLSAGEQDALRIFRERLSRLEQLEEDRAEQGRLYKEQQFGAKPDRAAAEATLNRMRVLDSQISKANLEVLDVEDKKVLRAVLQKARKVVETEERAHGQEMLARWRDRRNNAAAIKKYRERLRGDVDDLTNWVLHPDNKDIVKRIPDALKNSVIPFLSSINFMSKQSLRGKKGNTKADELFLENMKKLNAALKNNIDINGLYSGYNDLPPNFMDNLQRFIASTEALVKKSSGEFIINKMTAEELQELSKVVRTLKKYIMQVNRFHYNAMYQHVYEAGDNTIETLKEMDAAKGTGKISEFLLWQQIRPAYAFERFGEGGKSIYDGLRRGQAQLAFNTQKIVEFSEKTYTAAEVQAWEKELKTFYVTGEKLQIPVSTIMSIYRLSKDPEARYHMEGDGFRVATYTHDGKKISDVGHRFTTGEINQIIRALTPRQREVADQLQGFMAEQGGKWGNYVSVARFGEELFTNKNYFPINSDGRHLAGNTDEEHPSAAALYALLNMSFTKSRKEKAKNRIVVYSIFDVFANHMASMAQYNAMALPILDAVKWFHYQQVWIDEEGNKEVIGNVREQMARVYGVPEETRPGKGNAGYAVSFVENIIKAFNGTEAQGIPTDTFGLNATRRYNMAQVAFNFRVVVQQPLAITRAGMLVDYRSILRGLKANPATIRKNIEEMRKYSGIAAWKALGFYDINISRGLTDIIKHKSTIGDKISDVGMWGAEKADMMTWAAMWSAAKEEIRRKMHLSEEDARYYEEVTKLFEDIIYKTQVVDSVLTKNEFLRSKGAFARLVGSFMSEPTTTASMLIDAYDKYQADMQRGMDRRQAWEENKRRIGRLAYVYGLSAVMLAAVQAVADAWRDDDDYQTFLEKWLEAFGGNMVDELMPINKLPILSDVYELVKSLLGVLGVDTYGNPPQSVFMQWRDSLVDGTKVIYQKISGEDTNYTWYGGAYKLLQAASGLFGLPMASATRELVSAWNSTVGSFAPSLKVKTYEPSELAQIRYAYEDGHLTAEEATEQLLAQGLVDNEDEAYFTIAGWEAGEGYSRYDAMYDAIRNGGSVDEALAELTSHGYTEEEVFSQVKGQIGKWYRDGEISKAQATEMLTRYSRYFDMSSEEITATVNKWSAKVVTGIDFEDIGDEYEAGKITASRAIEMYMRYGGYTREEAQQKVTLIDFVKQHSTLEGISYAAVESYKEHAEGAGITAETFYDVWKYNSETQADVDASGKAISGSKKEKVLAYIHSMRLTAAQKDSLYYAFGWAQSKINEAPWR